MWDVESEYIWFKTLFFQNCCEKQANTDKVALTAEGLWNQKMVLTSKLESNGVWFLFMNLCLLQKKEIFSWTWENLNIFIKLPE